MTRCRQTCSTRSAPPPGSTGCARCACSFEAGRMAEVRPFQGIRYNPEHVRLGGVLAPPYDVISPVQLEELYGRDLRNVARIDFGMSYAGDEPGSSDRYTRAAEFLSSWLDLGVLVRDSQPSLYITDH